MVDGKVQKVVVGGRAGRERYLRQRRTRGGGGRVGRHRDIDVEDLYDDVPPELHDLVQTKAAGNDTPIVREDWEILAEQEAQWRGLYGQPSNTKTMTEDLSFKPEMTKPGFFKRMFGKKPKALTEPKFSIMDDSELDAFESLVKEANDFPMQRSCPTSSRPSSGSSLTGPSSRCSRARRT